jgi:hypothetical protein
MPHGTSLSFLHDGRNFEVRKVISISQALSFIIYDVDNGQNIDMPGLATSIDTAVNSKTNELNMVDFELQIVRDEFIRFYDEQQKLQGN